MTKSPNKNERFFFRFYSEALHDPKVQKLPGHVFKAWVNLLCVASKNDGLIMQEDVAFDLRVSDEDARQIIEALEKAGLLERLNADCLKPHNWDERQFVQGSAAAERQRAYRERMKKHPDNKAPVTRDVTRDVTPLSRVTVQEKEKEKEKEKDIEDIAPASGESDDAEADSKYAFSEDHIRLTHNDLGKLQRAYPDINVEGAIVAKAEWLKGLPGARWFHAFKEYLRKEDAKAKDQKERIRAAAEITRQNGGKARGSFKIAH